MIIVFPPFCVLFVHVIHNSGYTHIHFIWYTLCLAQFYAQIGRIIMDLLSLWEKMLANLKQVLPKEIFTNWFEGNIIPYSYSEEENLLILDTMTNFLRDYVSKKYTDILETVAQDAIGRPTRVQLITSQEKKPAPESQPEAVAETITLPKKPAAPPAPTAAAPAGDAQSVPSGQTEWVQPELPISDGPAAPMPVVKEAVPVTPDEIPYNNNLNKDYTFDNFIVGNSNRVATAVAKSIAAAPAQKWNPFYIYGGSGLGKTHLMHAIGHELLKNFPNMRLLCITSEDFVNEFIQCIQDKNTESFRRRYRNVDVLFVDDIQFLGRGDKESSKEEFFHTFNKLYQDKKQMVFTSDRPPRDIKKLEERLRSRFENGMVTQIEPPDLETRTAILRAWAEKENITCDLDALNYIAANVSENIRKLHGAFIRVLLEASQSKSNVTLPLVKHAIHYITDAQDEKKYITIDEITTYICQHYNINYKELMGKKKTKDIALPRQIAMYMCRELTGNTYPHIGTAFNGRDHTTVMHACSQIRKKIDKDSHFKEHLEKMMNEIRGVDN